MTLCNHATDLKDPVVSVELISGKSTSERSIRRFSKHQQITSKRRIFISKKRARPSGQPCVLKHFWAYPLIEMREMRERNLSTAIATFGSRYARELFRCYS